ncbi:hypothetical protein Tco_1295050 [Tanacetum coccineum]
MSLAEAEYVALSASYAQVMWMRTQLKDYGFNYNKIPLYCGSLSLHRISCTPVQTFAKKAHPFLDIFHKGAGISFKFDISGLLHHVITTIAYRIRDKDTSQSKQIFQVLPMGHSFKDLECLPSVLDSCFISFTVSEVKRKIVQATSMFQNLPHAKDVGTLSQSSSVDAATIMSSTYTYTRSNSLPSLRMNRVGSTEPLEKSWDISYEDNMSYHARGACFNP